MLSSKYLFFGRVFLKESRKSERKEDKIFSSKPIKEWKENIEL